MSASGRILVIDDEADLRNVVSSGLSGLGYEIVTAKDGEEGLARFLEQEFDLVLCDLVMPGLSGTEVLERIRRVDSNVPVLMITGYPTIETAVEAMRQGAYDYVSKPFSFDDLELRLQRCLEAKTAKQRARSARALSLGLFLSIPFWVILGLILALVFS